MVTCFNFHYFLFIKTVQAMNIDKQWINSSREQMPASCPFFWGERNDLVSLLTLFWGQFYIVYITLYL